MGESRTDAGGVRKAPRHEIAVEHVTAVPRALWGFGRGGWFSGLDCSGWGDGSAGEYGDWPGADALRGDAFGVRGGQNWRLCVSAGVAGPTPARAVGVRTMV